VIPGSPVAVGYLGACSQYPGRMSAYTAMVEYLKAENCLLREQLGVRRIIFSDAEPASY